MIVDWRRLFSHIGVHWIDHGKNHTKGNINIKCCWCSDDPSEHLGVSESKPAYYCYRDSRHAGGNLVRLLMRLGCTAREATRLLEEYGSKEALRPRDQEQAIARDSSKVELAWDRFTAAQDSPNMLGYLLSRGFPQPAVTCANYGLRYAQSGTWARRLLLPFRNEHDQIYTWVGRSIDPQLSPRYLMEDEKIPGACYMPRRARRVLHIVEGPLDALMVAVGSEGLDIAPVALAGKGINAAKLVRLRTLARGSVLAYLTHDPDVKLGEGMAAQTELQAALGIPVRRLKVPPDFEDPGAMSPADIQTWLAPNL